MKRFFSASIIVVLLLCLFSNALADDILFRGVSWGVTPKEARKQIDKPKVYMQSEYKNGSIAYPTKTAERILDQQMASK